MTLTKEEVGASPLRVLAFSRCYPPGFRCGGPVRSLVNLVQALGPHVRFQIVTLDRDLATGPPYPSVRPDVWQTVEPADVLYLPRLAVSVRRLSLEARTAAPDIVYLNSVFDSIFTLRVLVARRTGLFPAVPILLAPQGELSSGALSLKASKKMAFIKVAALCGLFRGVVWQASNARERDEILRALPSTPPSDIRVVADLTGKTTAAPFDRESSSASSLRLCFLSRISPKKNLDFALLALAEVAVAVDFTVYGPIEDAPYWAQCQQLIARLPSHVRVAYGGEVPPADVMLTLSRYDLLFFPTRGENFGHVIHEALSAGVPVLISDQTPWTDLESHGAGWSLALQTPSAFARTIDREGARLRTDREAFATRARAYAAAQIDRSAAVGRAEAMFRELVRP